MKRLLILLLVVALGALALTSGCGSLDKRSMQEQLLGLPGNERVAAALEHSRLELALPGVASPVEVAVLRLPRPDAPRLLLVHGTPGTLLNWTPVLFGELSETDAPLGEPSPGGPPFDGLAAHFDITAIELPGHGLSRDGLEPGTFQACADYLAAAADALGLPPSIVVGHSYGGEVAWRLALDRPDLVAALVLVDSSGYARADDEWLPEEEAMRDIPGAGFGWLLNDRDRIATALAPHFRDAPPPSFAEETFLVCDNAVNWSTMVDLARDENGTRAAELASLAVPTVLIWGDDDVAYPVETFGSRFAADIPDVELVVLEQCGHYPPLERPAEFVRVLRERFAAE